MVCPILFTGFCGVEVVEEGEEISGAISEVSDGKINRDVSSMLDWLLCWQIFSWLDQRFFESLLSEVVLKILNEDLLFEGWFFSRIWFGDDDDDERIFGTVFK